MKKVRRRILIGGENISLLSDWMDDSYFSYMDFLESHDKNSIRILIEGKDTLIPRKILKKCMITLVDQEYMESDDLTSKLFKQ